MMKQFLFTVIFLSTIMQASAQIEIAIGGQVVDPNQVYQQDASALSTSGQAFEIFWQNTSSDTLNVTLGFCLIQDDLDLKLSTLVFGHATSPFGGIGVPVSDFVQGDCFNIFNSSTIAQLLPGESMLSTNYVELSGSGCDTYRYTVYLTDTTEIVSLDVDFCTTVGIDEQPQSRLEVYPNPSSGTTYLKIPSPATRIQVRDLSGRDVAFRRSMHALSILEIELNESSGVYIVEVELETGQILSEQLIIR